MDQELIDSVSLLKRLYGIDISMYSEHFLLKSMGKGALKIGCESIGAYKEVLERDWEEVLAFLKSLNIGYSEFFRNPLTFATLESMVLPRLVSQKMGKGEIRVWSAGCAAGQEAYSIAILLDKLVRNVGKGVTFRIFATDISDTALEAARAGIYEADTMGNVRFKQLNNYFNHKGDCYEVRPELKEMVSFNNYDLLNPDSNHPAESIYGEFDLVFCSNLLFYYKPEAQRFILHKMQKSMAKNGFLVTGEAERALLEVNPRFNMVLPQVSIFQTKKVGGSYGREIQEF